MSSTFFFFENSFFKVSFSKLFVCTKKNKIINLLSWTVTHESPGRREENWEGGLNRGDKNNYKLLLVTAGKRMDTCSKVCSCLDFFLVAAVGFFCVCFSSWFCAISTDSSKVGKCRVACCSCLLRGEKPKQNTHTHTHAHTQSYNFHSLKMHWAPTFDRNVCFVFFPPYLWLFSSTLGWKQSRQTRFGLLQKLSGGGGGSDLLPPRWLVGWFVSQ